MSSEQLHQIIEKAICKQPQDDDGRYYHLCWWQEKLQCLPTQHTKDPHPIFFMAPGEAFTAGLSEHQWRLLERRFGDFCKDRKIDLSAVSPKRARKGRKVVPRKRTQVTEFDLYRLRALLATARQGGALPDDSMTRLQEILEQADVVAPREIPGDVVTMNSQVRLQDSRSREDMVVTVVFPGDAKSDEAVEQLRASILTPMGLSVFGRRVGDELDGKIRVHELLFQPEAAGNFEL